MNQKTLRTKKLYSVGVTLATLLTNSMYAQGSGYCDNAYGLQEVFCNVLGDFSAIANLMGGFAYVMGLAFGVAAVLKFKQHRDSPTQVQIGHPIAYLATSVGLVFFPSLVTESAETAFSSVDKKYSGVFVDPSVWTG